MLSMMLNHIQHLYWGVRSSIFPNQLKQLSKKQKKRDCK